MARKHTEDFASASLVALVVTSVREADPALLPSGTAAPDPMRAATVAASDKRDLLDHIYRRRGAGPLLSVGRGLDAAASPMLAVLANAAQPDILIDKWMRLERYGHAFNRTDISLESGNALDCRRWSKGAPPTAAENALIAGVLFGLCGIAGARRRTLAVGGQVSDAAGLPSIGPLPDGGMRFRITWDAWEPSAPQRRSPGAATGEQLKALLAGDVARGWSLREAASLLAKSTRTLQREIAAEGLTFSTALRRARLDEAARLLRENDASLAEIGFCCGYADQPHFQRDFRRALNLSPGRYRSVARA